MKNKTLASLFPSILLEKATSPSTILRDETELSEREEDLIRQPLHLCCINFAKHYTWEVMWDWELDPFGTRIYLITKYLEIMMFY